MAFCGGESQSPPVRTAIVEKEKGKSRNIASNSSGCTSSIRFDRIISASLASLRRASSAPALRFLQVFLP